MLRGNCVAHFLPYRPLNYELCSIRNDLKPSKDLAVIAALRYSSLKIRGAESDSAVELPTKHSKRYHSACGTLIYNKYALDVERGKCVNNCTVRFFSVAMTILVRQIIAKLQAKPDRSNNGLLIITAIVSTISIIIVTHNKGLHKRPLDRPFDNISFQSLSDPVISQNNSSINQASSQDKSKHPRRNYTSTTSQDILKSSRHYTSLSSQASQRRLYAPLISTSIS